MKNGFVFEKKLWRVGYPYIGGADEVGRGAFAGPVVAACVVFSKKTVIPESIEINDSKKLTPEKREKSSFWIKRNALSYGIGSASVSEINRLGIKKATEIAFRKAIRRAGNVDFLLIDAFFVPYVLGLRRKNQRAIVKGDSKSYSIAGASIIAKVYRDKYVEKLGKKRKFKKYGWEKNKGYGTLMHRKAIGKFGASKHHRTLFIESSLFPKKKRTGK